MAFSLQPAGLEDVEDIVRIFQAAFKKDPIMGRFHANSPPHLVWEKDLKVFSDMMAEGDVYGGRFAKVVEDETG